MKIVIDQVDNGYVITYDIPRSQSVLLGSKVQVAKDIDEVLEIAKETLEEYNR